MMWLIRVLYVVSLACFALAAIGLDLIGKSGSGVRTLPLGLFFFVAALLAAML